MFAIVEINGFQYKVEENQTIKLTKVNNFEKGKKIETDKVLLLSNDKSLNVGKPYVKGAKVIFELIGEKKGRKIEVMKFRRRSNYKRIKGYRDNYTLAKIEKIVTP
ncbi:MAG: 50S ribosomal protein L21 [bacterium]|nr:50S ribosomal protein L21 [bacterium]